MTGAGVPVAPDGIDLWAVLADDDNGLLHVARSRLTEDRFPSLTPECPQVHWFEREIAEQSGVRPEGHGGNRRRNGRRRRRGRRQRRRCGDAERGRCRAHGRVSGCRFFRRY